MAMVKTTLREAWDRASCDRCEARYRTQANAKKKLWNIVWSKGIITGFLCPDCQTDAESAEATINEATLDYGTMTTDANGRMQLRRKGVGA